MMFQIGAGTEAEVKKDPASTLRLVVGIELLLVDRWRHNAPNIAPSTWARDEGHVAPRKHPGQASAIVTAGLSCAPDRQATLAPTRPQAHPIEMSSRSLPCPERLLQGDVGADAYPSRISRAVPMNSLAKGSNRGLVHGPTR